MKFVVARFRHQRVLGLTGKETKASGRRRRRRKQRCRDDVSRSRVGDIKERVDDSRGNPVERGERGEKAQRDGGFAAKEAADRRIKG